MRVKFRVDKNTVFPSDNLKRKWSAAFGEHELRLLNHSQTFTVYMIIVDNESIDYFPVNGYFNFDSELFDIVDPRISRYWRIAEHDRNSGWVGKMILSYLEFIEDKNHMMGLVDGVPSACELFLKYKQMMDLEFRDPDVKKRVQVLEGNWVMCPDCCESWEDKSDNEMTRCPKCQSLFLREN